MDDTEYTVRRLHSGAFGVFRNDGKRIGGVHVSRKSADRAKMRLLKSHRER